MARPKEFNTDEVLQKALLTFWEKGYENTSIADLENSMGISRISIYNSFKDKESIFLKILSMYHEMAKSYLNDHLKDKSIEGIISFVKSMFENCNEDSPTHFGCLMVNTVLDMGKFSKAVEDKVKDNRTMMKGRFEEILLIAHKEGKIKNSLSPQNSASFLVSSLWGAMATMRLYRDAKEIEPISLSIIETIKSWQTD